MPDVARLLSSLALDIASILTRSSNEDAKKLSNDLVERTCTDGSSSELRAGLVAVIEDHLRTTCMSALPKTRIQLQKEEVHQTVRQQSSQDSEAANSTADQPVTDAFDELANVDF
ncbi:uncharacterized protein LOC135814238 [Sycon ciliatum]|uniref:uncharacterized protein LOC135814238 n=1 Tax=Sycon ciliatum TaxID=27933 RepID=UPI0031F6B52A